MKIIAYCALKYGADYLGWSIKSVIDYIDEYHVLYAMQPSHGHYSAIPCPETEAELYEIAHQAAGSKLRWHAGNWTQEGEQRNAILQLAPDADVIISIDYDEVWTEKTIGLFERNLGYQGSYIAIPMIHQWRSFHKAITNDLAAPARILFPKSLYKDQHIIANLDAPIIHFGYAIKPKIMQYKWLIHGHLNELRHDVNWYKDKFLANAQIDVHPVGHQWALVEDVNPDMYMPNFMKEHPFYNLKVIE